MVTRMNGVQYYVWRAVDQRGVCLGVLVTRRRDTYAARTFLRTLLKSQGHTPRALITNKLRSYGAAKREVMASVCHRQSKYLNNRAENSHQRTRQREYAMRRFASPRGGTLHGSVPSTIRFTSISGHPSINGAQPPTGTHTH